MIKNVIAIFAIIILLGAGYFVFFNSDSLDLNFASDANMSAQLLQNTQLFIERQQQLQSIALDTALLDDRRFRRLTANQLPVPVVQVGKSQLFDPISSSAINPTNINIPNPDPVDTFAE